MRQALIAAIVGVAVLSAPVAVADSTPHIGSSKSSIGSPWRPGGCTKQRKLTVCAYTYALVQISAYFQGSTAVGFVTMAQFKPTEQIYARFLVSMVPPGAPLQSCKVFKRTSLHRPAKACVFTYRGRPILVEQDLTMTDGMTTGRVLLGQDFRNLKP